MAFITTSIPVVGDTVRFVAWGGDVRLGDVGSSGVVVRMNRNGYPVVRFYSINDCGEVDRTDRYGCARVVHISKPEA